LTTGALDYAEYGNQHQGRHNKRNDQFTHFASTIYTDP
jgi:hypothetical protein